MLLGLTLGLPDAVAGLESTWQAVLEWLASTVAFFARAWHSLAEGCLNLASILAPQLKMAFFAISCLFFTIAAATALFRIWQPAKFYLIVAIALLTIAAIFAGAWELLIAIAGIVLLKKGLTGERSKPTCAIPLANRI